MRGLWLGISLLVAGFAPGAHAQDYDVGPGKAYENVGDVPWESLAAGDNVRIHYKADPYREKFVVGGSGTEAMPITISGVLGPNGERPVIDGENATTRSQLNFWNEVRMVVKFGGANAPSESPSYAVLENLEIRGGHPSNTFSDTSGATQSYAGNAASILIENGNNITIRNCDINGSANGLFAASASTDILVEGNHIHDNGEIDDIFVHNNYTEAHRITFQYNHFGPLCDGCSGNNLKDRSAGTVVRYNWIEGGNRALDLVESDFLTDEPEYDETFVYGNVLIELEGGNSQVLHYGGDGGDTGLYRKGTLDFHNNTVVSYRAGNTTVMRLSTGEELADARNNILWAQAGGDRLGMVDGDGTLELRDNWISTGWVDSHGGAGTVVDMGGLDGDAPGFVDEAGGDYHITAGSPARDAGGALAAATMPDHVPVREYVVHQDSIARSDDAMIDMGAFEHCEVDCDPGGETGDSGGSDTSGGSGSGDASASASASASDSASGGTTFGGSGTSAGTDSGSASGGDSEGGGCGCGHRQRAAPLWLLLVLVFRRCRRRAS